MFWNREAIREEIKSYMKIHMSESLDSSLNEMATGYDRRHNIAKYIADNNRYFTIEEARAITKQKVEEHIEEYIGDSDRQQVSKLEEKINKVIEEKLESFIQKHIEETFFNKLKKDIEERTASLVTGEKVMIRLEEFVNDELSKGVVQDMVYKLINKSLFGGVIGSVSDGKVDLSKINGRDMVDEIERRRIY